MREILVEAHSGIRWLVVLVGIIALVKFLIGWFGSGQFGDNDTKLWKAINGLLGVQFLLGLILIIWGAVGGFGSDWLRIHGEHLVTMLIAIGVLGATSSRAKKAATDQQKFMTSSIGLLIGAVLIFVGVARVMGWS